VAHSAIIVGMNPIVILLLASLVGLERLNPRRIAGMLLALAGVAVLKIFQAEPKGASAPTWAGDLLVFLSGFMFALFTIFGKRATGKHTSITVNTFAYVGGAVALAPLTLWQAAAFPFARVSATGWLSLTYMALCPSVIAYLIYYHALTRIPASRVAAFCYFQPLMATMLGVLMLGEHLSVPLVAGGTIIFCGVYLAERG
jgi:drug/metabolite transporter (DMT)-like permease